GLAGLDGGLGELDRRALSEDRVLEGGFRRRDARGRRLLAREGGVQVLLGNRLLLDERTVARHVGAVLAEIGLGLIEARASPIDDRRVLRAKEIGLGLGQLGARRLERRLVLLL